MPTAQVTEFVILPPPSHPCKLAQRLAKLFLAISQRTMAKYGRYTGLHHRQNHPLEDIQCIYVCVVYQLIIIVDQRT